MNVYICSAARTAIGTYGGTLRDVHSSELGTAAAKAAIERAGVDKEAIDEVLFGQVLQGGVGQNVARQVCLECRSADHHPGHDPEQGLRCPPCVPSRSAPGSSVPARIKLMLVGGVRVHRPA